MLKNLIQGESGVSLCSTIGKDLYVHCDNPARIMSLIAIHVKREDMRLNISIDMVDVGVWRLVVKGA